jgi:hypothetical protein
MFCTPLLLSEPNVSTTGRSVGKAVLNETPNRAAAGANQVAL